MISLSPRGPFSLVICIIFAHEASKLTLFHPKTDAQTIVFVERMRFRTFALGAHFGSIFMRSKIVLPPTVGGTFSNFELLPAAWRLLLRGCSFGVLRALPPFWHSRLRGVAKKKMMTPLVRECHFFKKVAQTTHEKHHFRFARRVPFQKFTSRFFVQKWCSHRGF